MSLDEQIRECMRLADKAKVECAEHTRHAQEAMRRAEVLGDVVKSLMRERDRGVR